jgi:alpha-glucosidase
LEVGRFEPVETDGDVLAYLRRGREGEGAFLVALNLGPAIQALRTSVRGTIALSTQPGRLAERVRDTLDLRPDEGVVVRL